MGLDTSHNCWHGSYSGFNNFRRLIAKTIGFDLDTMEGYGGEVSWDTLGDDPIVVLLDHSDCDGEILHADCERLAIRLEEIAPQLPNGDVWSAQQRALQFAQGLRDAHEAGENVDFH